MRILSSFSNFYRVLVDQVPATDYVGQLVNWSIGQLVTGCWSLVFAEILSSFSNFYQVAVDQVPVTVYVWSIGHWLLVIAEILSPFSNLHQVPVNQVPAIGHWS